MLLKIALDIPVRFSVLSFAWRYYYFRKLDALKLAA
jgi:hypothetical protein